MDLELYRRINLRQTHCEYVRNRAQAGLESRHINVRGSTLGDDSEAAPQRRERPSDQEKYDR